MTTDNKLNPASAPSTFPDRTTNVATEPAVVHPKETEMSDAEKIANRLAHKANKTEQNYDSSNGNLFTK